MSLEMLLERFDGVIQSPVDVEKLNQSILKWAVMGRLVPQDPNDEPAEVLLKRITAEKTELIKKGKIKKGKSLPPIDHVPYGMPRGWEWARFSDVANIASNLVNPHEHLNFPHIAPNNIEKSTGRLLAYNTVEEDGVKSSKHHFFPGQIIYSKIRPNLSKAIIVDFEGLCSADMYPIWSFIDTHYLHLFILSPIFVSMAVRTDTRVAMPKINQSELNRIPVAVPPLNEQHRIVLAVRYFFEQTLELADSLQTAEDQRGKLLDAILFGAVA